MKSPQRAHAKLAAMLAVSCVVACDCDERLRKALSNDDGAQRRMSPESAVADGPGETEPNNDAANASPVVIGRELRAVHGEITLPEDADWFALSAAADESLEVTVTPDSMLDIVLEVALPDGSVSRYDAGRRGDAESIAVLRVGPTPQRFAVRPIGSSTGSYTISFKRRVAAAGLEAEPNDEAGVATPFTVPGEIKGYFDRREDRDVYALRGAPGAAFELELGAVQGVRQIATFFDDPSLAQPLLAVQVTESMPTRVPNLAIGPSGTLYLVLAPLGGASRERSYTLRATAHPPVAPGLLELEPNDGRPMKLSFGAGATAEDEIVVRGYLHTADDIDRFSLGASPEPPRAPAPTPVAADSVLAPYVAKPRTTAPVSATLTWTDPESTYGLQWTTADGIEAQFRRDSAEPSVTACGMNLGAGEATLAVRVERLATSPKTGEPPYTLTISDLSAAAAWEAEPNNAAREADALVHARRGTFGQYEDVDAFAFSVDAAEGATQSVRLAASTRRADIIMRVTDDGGGVVANVDNAPVGGGESTSLDLPAGLYFVELRWKGGELCEPYELKLAPFTSR